MNKKNLKLVSAGVLVTLAMSQAHALTQQQLTQMIECQATSQQYMNLGFDYEDHLKKLGWKKIEIPDQPMLYVYKNAKSVQLFGRTTHEIALSGSAIFAVFRDANVKQLAQQFKIPEYTEYGHLPFFRGVKKVRTESVGDEKMTYHVNLNLSEMRGKQPLVLLGCSYEPDREQMEKLFKSSGAE